MDTDDMGIPSDSNKATFIVKDERAALKMRQEETREAEAKYRAIVAREKQAAKASAAIRKADAKLELAKLRLRQSASEKARTNIAISAPLMVTALVGGFIIALASGKIPDESISVASALLTLLTTGLLANLRSIISEGASTETNGHDAPPPPKKPKTEKA